MQSGCSNTLIINIKQANHKVTTSIPVSHAIIICWALEGGVFNKIYDIVKVGQCYIG